jgi:hypothetical protein
MIIDQKHLNDMGRPVRDFFYMRVKNTLYNLDKDTSHYAKHGGIWGSLCAKKKAQARRIVPVFL